MGLDINQRNDAQWTYAFLYLTDLKGTLITCKSEHLKCSLLSYFGLQGS